jgi:hypothetical protein
MATRKRRTLKPRNARTYYAMTKDENTLIRFANHAQRLDAIRKEGLVPLGALEYREKIATDSEGKLKMLDRRGELKAFEAAQAAAANAAPAPQPTTQTAPLSPKQTESVLESAPPQGGDTVMELGAAIAAALKPFLERGHIQITPQGVQPVQSAQPGKQH